MVPANECLDAADVASGQIDFGLVVQDERVGGQGDPKLLQGAQSGVDVGVVGAGVDVVSVSGGLGLVHGDVGPTQQSAQILAVVGEQGDADADVALQGDALQGERLGHHRAQLFGDFDGQVVVGVLEEDRELIPAQAGQQVTGPQLLGQAGSDLDQESVPDVVAQAVVDLLELVQVQQQQRLTVDPRCREPDGHIGVQSPPVRQAGQVVGDGLAAQVRHLHEHPEGQLGAGRRRQQGHCGQGHRQVGHVDLGAQDQHPQPCGRGHNRHRQGARTAR